MREIGSSDQCFGNGRPFIACSTAMAANMNSIDPRRYVIARTPIPTCQRSDLRHTRPCPIARHSPSSVSSGSAAFLMKSSTNRIVPWGGFCAAVVALGLRYWLIPYGTVSLPKDLLGPQLGVLAFACAMAIAFGATKPWRSLLIFSAAAPTTVMLRVVVECTIDPTRHNLWPFEIGIAYGVGLPWAAGGAILGWCLAWVRRERTTR